MSFTKNIVLIVSISSLLLLHSTNAIHLPVAVETGVTKLCKGTTDPILCVKTILPQMHGNFNAYTALEAEILAAKDQVLKASTVIDSLLKNPTTPKGLKDSLAVCQNQYGVMVDSVNEAIAAVSKRDAWSANLKFSAVFSYRQTCDEAFDPEVPPTNLSNVEATLKLVAGNVLDISKGLEDKESEKMKNKGSMTDYSKITSPPSKCLHVVGPCTE
ncbi:hypothetical protein TanjilG_17898 [Lupinus angustifolius]|uniref:Pectinesterase inhibitor domain-containing protein n=1 Tax=Lupinus angustifolius TaxID=3871 RepID=A0A4P1QQ32_LUPAN|nr:PREDICTED: uncharacterized protein LOC109333727 [Lupinus angustifolius]OIV91906.1 hypothetical protein TanjilG_17898 [Lupinus angustifolius]